MTRDLVVGAPASPGVVGLRPSPWQHQQDERSHALDPARAFLDDPRTGKSYKTVLTMERLYEDAHVRRFLIITPKTAAALAWLPELQNSEVFCGCQYDLTEGTIASRRDFIKSLRPDFGCALVVNPEVLYDLKMVLKKWGPQFIAADESHGFKNAGAKRTRALWTLGDQAEYRRILTGTPDPNGYEDFYAQYRFVDPSIFGTRKDAFEEKYIDRNEFLAYRPVVGYRNLPELREKLFSIATRIRREDIWEMPTAQEIIRHVSLPPASQEAYRTLAKDRVLGDTDATHALTRLLRLQQLTAGFKVNGVLGVPEEVSVKTIRDNTAKQDAVVAEAREIVDAGKRAVVFYRFEFEGHELQSALREVSPRVSRISGTGQDRQRAIQDFNEGKVPVIVVQESIAQGFPLYGDFAIFTTLGFDAAAHIQARDRLAVPGKKVGYIYLLCPGTVDLTAKYALETKTSAMRLILDVGFEAASKGEVK